ncbi:hypothetical protein JCM11641_006202 [Rhodosporidiobolus odoratus]
MAKSLRSKGQRKNRAIKRDDPKSAFHMAEQLRLQRLATSLKQSSLKPRALTDKEEWERKQEGFETESENGEEDVTEGAEKAGGEEDATETDAPAASASTSSEPGKKPSTSGPRMSRREAYRASKGFTVKQTPRTQFPAKGEKSRRGCKPHRRR